MARKDKIAANYRAADRMRKERELREAKEAEELLKQQARSAMARARTAEQTARDMRQNARVLEQDFLEHVVAATVAKLIRQMGTQPYAEVVGEFMRRALIRIDKFRMPEGVEVMIRNDNDREPAQVTVTIPEMRLTEILSDDYLDTLGMSRSRGPTIMEDRPIRMVKASFADYSPLRGNDPVDTKEESF